MGQHLSKTERQQIVFENQQKELHIQEAAKLNQSFLYVISRAQQINLRNTHSGNARFRFMVSFLTQNEGVVKKEILKRWMISLVFLTENLEKKCPKWFKQTDYLRALIELAKYRSSWIRPLEGWKPKLKSDYERFKELVTYLFALYPFPAVLNHLFFHQEDFFFVKDFIYLAQGGSMRNINTTIPLTHKMRIEFIKSPDGFRIHEAFRYAQVRGLGGDELLAHRMAYSWLGRNTKRDEVLWETFIRIVIAGGMFNQDKLDELIDYIRHQRNENQGYSLKGRTLQSLIRQSDPWHNGGLKVQQLKGIIAWKSALFEPFELRQGKAENEILYQMVELLSNKELIAEGTTMHHCVGSYSYYCAKGQTRIVSLRKYQFGIEIDRMATIEVDLRAKQIVQAKCRYNKPISGKALSLLHSWANLNGLLIGKYL